MKVTDYYPVFYASDVEAEVKRLEEVFGFTVIHNPAIENVEYYVLENEHKRRIDLVYPHFPLGSFSDGYWGMRVNVDNFEEGVAYFKEQGYSILGQVIEDGPKTLALLAKNDGTFLAIFHHNK